MQALDQSQEVSCGVDTRERSITPSITKSMGHWQRVLSLRLRTHHYHRRGQRTPGRRPDRARNRLCLGAGGVSGRRSVLADALCRADRLGHRPGLQLQFPAAGLEVRARTQLRDALAPAAARPRPAPARSATFRTCLSPSASMPAATVAYAASPGTNSRQCRRPRTRTQHCPQVRTGGRHLLTGTVEVVRDLPRSLATRCLH